jgi:hypothetical protein
VALLQVGLGEGGGGGEKYRGNGDAGEGGPEHVVLLCSSVGLLLHRDERALSRLEDVQSAEDVTKREWDDELSNFRAVARDARHKAMKW